MEPTEKKSGFLRKSLIVVGVMFAVIGMLIVGMVVALLFLKPYGLDVMAPFKGNKGVPYDHPLLSPAQEKTLQSLGIDPAVLPTSITSSQARCGVEVLGQKRAQEILAGSTPTMMEILSLKKCL